MHAWNILKHSINLVLINYKTALRISLPVYITVAVVVGLVTHRVWRALLNGDPVLAQLALRDGFALIWTVSFFAIVIGIYWVAVAWHRYVLMNEQPEKLFPPFHGDRILTYFFKMMFVAFLSIMAVLFPLIMLQRLTRQSDLLTNIGASGLSTPEMVVIQVVMTTLLGFVMLRLSPLLPAAAIGTPMKTRDAWRATSEARYAILQLAGAYAVVTTVWALVIPVFSLGHWSIDLSVQLVWSWITSMVGISLLTTIYGVYVEKRSIDGEGDTTDV